MSLNKNSFNDIKYIDCSTGTDETESGTQKNPYKTLSYCLSQINKDNTLVVLSKGTYDVQGLDSLSLKDYMINYVGKNNETIINITKRSVGCRFLNKTNFYNLIIKFDDSYNNTNEYWQDTFEVNFYNIFFKNNSSNLIDCVYVQNSSSTTNITNKKFYNCTLDNMYFAWVGVPEAYNSATTKSYFHKNDTSHTMDSHYHNCVNSETLDENYKLTVNDNNIYGIYSGDFKWEIFLFLLLKDNNYFSVKEDFYDTSLKQFNSISPLTTDNFDDYGFEINELFNELTLENETFKPIDKFDKFKLISNKNISSLSLLGIKSKKEMIVGKTFIGTKLASNIDHFKHIFSVAENCSIKIAIDNGEGIKYTNDNGETWTNSSLILPQKEFNTLTEEELTNWNNIMEEVYNNGFDISETENINFNNIINNTQKIKFIYVIEISSVNDECYTSELDWQFDSIGNFLQLDKSELEISQSNENISLKALKDIDMLKLNVGSNNDIMIESSEDEINTMINNGWSE